MLLLPADAADVKKVCRTICVCFPYGGCGSAGAAWRHVMMNSGAFPLRSEYPVAIVGAGPVGLTTALALSYYKIPFVVFEANASAHWFAPLYYTSYAVEGFGEVEPPRKSPFRAPCAGEAGTGSAKKHILEGPPRGYPALWASLQTSRLAGDRVSPVY